MYLAYTLSTRAFFRFEQNPCMRLAVKAGLFFFLFLAYSPDRMHEVGDLKKKLSCSVSKPIARKFSKKRPEKKRH